MYIHIYAAVFLWIFAIYGFLYFVYRVFESLNLRKKSPKGMHCVIVTAQNQEQVLEGLVREWVRKASLEGREEELLHVILVDAGSTDDTYRIMNRLAKEYDFIQVAKPEEVQAFIQRLAR